jgi:RNA recognition motif-containing protein
VTFTSESDAAAAVSQLDKSEIAGRQVNVEVAKPMPTPTNGGAAAASAPRRAAKKAAQLAATKQTAQDAAAGTSEGEGASAAATGAKKARKPVSLFSQDCPGRISPSERPKHENSSVILPRRRQQRKPRGPRTPRADDETEEAGDAPVSNNAVSDAADALAGVSISDKQPRTSKRKPRARKDRKSTTVADGEVIPGAESGEPPALGARDGTTTTSAGAAPSSARTRRGPPSTGVASPTLVFVGNLNFSVTNSLLKAAFEPACKVKSAVVVVRKFGQSAGRSKGFAFVDFESNEDQQRALNEFQGRELEGRPMSIKVAIQPEGGHEAAEANKKAEKAAAKVNGSGAADKSAEEVEAEVVASSSTPQQQRTEGDAVIVAQ